MSPSTIEKTRQGRSPEARPTERPAVQAIVPSSYFRLKPWIEQPIAAILLLPALAVIGLLVIVVRLTSPGPAIFRQQRVGRGGRIFTMYKIRTMRQDAEKGTGAVWAQHGDPRVTPVGRVLRKLHLDEFPQLFNVLRGEMSLIGPRPERPEFTQQLAVKLPGYLDRLLVQPGITGLAQINLPPDTDLESVRQKLYLDKKYIVEASLLLDVRMTMCTATRLIGVPGGLAMRAFGLRRPVPSTTATHGVKPANVDLEFSADNVPLSHEASDSDVENGDVENSDVENGDLDSSSEAFVVRAVSAASDR